MPTISRPARAIEQMLAGVKPEGAALAELGRALDALFTVAISGREDGLGTGNRFRDLVTGTELIRASRIILSNNPADTDDDVPALVLQNNQVTLANPLIVRTGAVMTVSGAAAFFGVGASATEGLLYWRGPIVTDIAECSIGNALQYAGVFDGVYVEGTSGAGGALNKSASSVTLTVPQTVSIIHSDDGTMGGNALGTGITVTYSYAWTRRSVGAASPAPGPTSASLELTRDKAGGGAVVVASPTASGVRTVENLGPGQNLVEESMSVTGTYVDPDLDTDPRTYALTLLSRTGTGTAGDVAQSLAIGSNEIP